MAVLESLIEVIPERIAQGEMVGLGDFGSFFLTLSSIGSEKEEDVTAKNIQDNKLNFRPGKIIENTMKTLEYKKVAVEAKPATAKAKK